MISQYPKFKANFLAWIASDGTDIVLSWVTLTGVTTDPATGAQVGTPTTHTETVKGMIHYPEIALKSVKLYDEIETGDIIVDLPETVVLEGRQQLKITISGEQWEQKTIGPKLAIAWGMIHKNSRLCRTLLLRKAS